MTSRRQALHGACNRRENLRPCPVDEPRDHIARPVPGLNLGEALTGVYQLTIR